MHRMSFCCWPLLDTVAAGVNVARPCSKIICMWPSVWATSRVRSESWQQYITTACMACPICRISASSHSSLLASTSSHNVCSSSSSPLLLLASHHKAHAPSHPRRSLASIHSRARVFMKAIGMTCFRWCLCAGNSSAATPLSV